MTNLMYTRDEMLRPFELFIQENAVEHRRLASIGDKVSERIERELYQLPLRREEDRWGARRNYAGSHEKEARVIKSDLNGKRRRF